MEGPTRVGDWQKISDLGSGSFGVVSLWKNSSTNDFIAIKKCKFQITTNLTPKQRERWKNEVQIMRAVDHPNVIKFKTIPSELETALLKHNPTKLPLLPMEYCLKGNLRHVLNKPENISGLKEQDVRDILQDVGNGVEYLHSLNITHRDIKPDNIVLHDCDSRKTHTIYKIIDLGYAKELNDSVVSFVGTLYYLAPEIFRTEQYNSSVDYWSMGILTFEIICGVLPFLPSATPFERFQYIQNKESQHICIYVSYSGNVTYSAEIKKEHYISNCLKQNIEVWLRHVLQFNQEERSKCFPNSVTVFDYLKNVLQMKIVNVFSVYKLEFYSYEFNEGTLVGTLKDWISRDIKVSKNDLILLFNTNDFCMDDSQLLCNVLQGESNVFVIKKGTLLSDSINYNFPKLVRELFKLTLKFNMKYIKRLYTQVVYYVTLERSTMEYFKSAFYSYINYLKYFIELVMKNGTTALNNLSKLLRDIEYYNVIRKNNVCDIDLSRNEKYKRSLMYRQRLLSSLERTITNFKKLQQKTPIIEKQQKIVINLLQEIHPIINDCNLEKQYGTTVTLLKSTAANTTILPAIRTIISDTIKVKDKFVNNKELQNYTSAIARVLNSAEKLNGWIGEFNTHISELSKSFEQNELLYRDIVSKAAESKIEKSKSVDSLNGELLSLPTNYLIQENYILRYKFEDILSKSILAHKNYTESVKRYL